MTKFYKFLFSVLSIFAYSSCNYALAQTNIAGEQVFCVDFRGIPVKTFPNMNLPDVGRAYVHPSGVPIIELNPLVLSRLPKAIQLFWYAHECAHHRLGHIVNRNLSNEMEADCLAIRIGRDQRWLSRDDVLGMVPYFMNNPGSPFGHLPGPARLNNFAICYST